MRVTFLLIVLAAITVILPLESALAQSTAADIIGSIKDTSGATISDVSVKVVHEETNFSRETKTNREGIYEFRILPPGTYAVTAEAAGFEKYINQNIPLTARRLLRIDIVLAIGEVTESVTVTAEAPAVNTDTGTVSESRDSKLLTDGPRGTPVMAKFGISTSKHSLLLRDGGWVEASYKANGSHARQWQASFDGNAAEVAYPGLGIPYSVY